eukprot:GEMP01014995.1.p1 GENE.GEMP01014995.1~~GEMP01014995.1.p1  ORF type:complete len:558 (+),score=107.23 GEMP01014995.1:230-1903(+)
MGCVQAKSIAMELESEFPGLSRHLIKNCVLSFKGPIHECKYICRNKLRELDKTKHFSINQQLATLDHIFPLVPKCELRRCIKMADSIFHATEYVLSSKTAKLGKRAKLARVDLFRPPEFQNALRNTMLNRYPMLWSGSVEQVLIEKNYDPDNCIRILDALDRKRVPGWFDWWERGYREVPHANMLHKELQRIQVAHDRAYARELNQKEYELSGNAAECACCFSGVPYEDIAPCSEGHLFCSDCIQRFVTNLTQGSFGTKATERHIGGPKCFSTEECEGVIERKYLSEGQLVEIDEFMLKQCFNASARRDLDLTLCYYCGDQTRPPRTPTQILMEQKQVALWLALVAFIVARFIVLRLYIGIAEAVGVLFCYCAYSSNMVLRRAILEWAEKLGGNENSTYVRCVNPSCSVEFCKTCSGEADHNFPHLCYDGVPDDCTIEAFMAYVGCAMSRIAVRVCPKCMLQFQKEDGCNRMRCQCGYEMCYLCRREVTDYKHFCEHFRTVMGAQCSECNKCELWRAEDGPNVVQAAREAASLFLQRHPNLRSLINGPVVIQGVRVF